LVVIFFCLADIFSPVYLNVEHFDGIKNPLSLSLRRMSDGTPVSPAQDQALAAGKSESEKRKPAETFSGIAETLLSVVGEQVRGLQWHIMVELL
jgi:hypothetical protein